jgi:hypothetical protein
VGLEVGVRQSVDFLHRGGGRRRREKEEAVVSNNI